MEVDIRTVILVIGIFRLIQVLVFFYQYKAARHVMGPGWWLIWSVTEAVGAVVILMRNIPGLLPVVIIFQNTIIVSAFIFFYIGVLRFFEKIVPWKFIYFYFLTYFTLHLFFIFVIDNAEIRTVLLYTYISVTAFLAALSIFRNKTPSIALTANANTVILLLHGSIYAFRVGMILSGTPSPTMFTSSPVNFLVYFDALVLGILLTFGIIILVNQRLNSEISETKTHFEKIFNTTPDAVLIIRISDRMLVDCNESFYKIFGYSKADLEGETSILSKLLANPDDFKALIEKIREKGSCENCEIRYQKKDGTICTGLLSAGMITLKGVPHLISVMLDISRRKSAEEELTLVNYKLTKNNAEKDKLFSIIAHDLISPFNIFLGLTELMMEENSDNTLDSLKKHIVVLNNSAKNLFKLLENLLEWSRLERGLIPFNPAYVKLLPLVAESIETVTEHSRVKGIKINNEIPGNIYVFADTRALQTILRNLVSNAVKFTPKNGEIVVSAKNTGDQWVEISVRDTGIGMSRPMIGSLFRLDAQINRKGTEGEYSTGLGLVICKDFIEKHSGKMWVVSEENKGSEFYFTIPSKAPSEIIPGKDF